jgi:hypothetical protein
MSHTVGCVAVAALVIVINATSVKTESPLPRMLRPPSHAAVSATHPLLRSRLVEIARRGGEPSS